MSIPKIWWIEDSDDFSVQLRIEAVKEKQLKNHVWIKFNEDKYKNDDEAKTEFLRIIQGSSLFEDGKVIVLRGLPSFISSLNKDKTWTISDNVLVILIASIETSSAFYKRIKCYIDNEEARIDDEFVLDATNIDEWIKKRAEALGCKIDSINQLILKTGYDPNRITNELRKLKHLDNGNIVPWMIDKEVSSLTNNDPRILTQAILNKDKRAYEIVDKMLLNGSFEGVVAYLVSWARNLAIVESCGRNINEADKSLIGSLRKLDNEKEVLMFNKPQASYYWQKDLAGQSAGFGYKILNNTERLAQNLREQYGSAKKRLIFECLNSVMK